ncbi:MAG: NAD-dependent epimerase/dehydratase family protein [Sphingobacteriales bacterium]|nr:NAD-dependent epimerase/dehydratase family protein [Sphingobacteriales bacterium]
MKVVVTGGAGFIGSSVCLQLKQKYPAYSFTAFDNLRRTGSELNMAELKKNGIRFIHGDIRCREDVEALTDFDALIDASAEPSVQAGLNNDPAYIINNNLNGSINCFNTCLKNNATLIFLSSSRVYPINRIEKANFKEEPTRFSFSDKQSEKGISKLGISEDLELSGARSFYGATKLASELFIREYCEFYKLKAAITRLGVIAGPRQMAKADQGVATLWLAKHFWKRQLSYIGYGGHGKQVRDILHIDDLVELIDMQLHQTEKFNDKVFNAGGGLYNSVSLQEMTTVCEQITGNKIRIESELQNRQADLRIFITDHSRISNETGWLPKKNVETIFTDIFNWIRENEAALKPLLS